MISRLCNIDLPLFLFNCAIAMVTPEEREERALFGGWQVS